TVTESTSRTQYQQDADDTNLFDYSFSSSPSITSPPDSDYLLSQSMHLEKASTTYEIDMESYIISCIARGSLSDYGRVVSALASSLTVSGFETSQ
ncbi:hypothetical protein QU857_27185, partial [Escherichia coli]|nr:hypothetical protein [Escherichia coli]